MLPTSREHKVGVVKINVFRRLDAILIPGEEFMVFT
jgi:hypothetical protein